MISSTTPSDRLPPFPPSQDNRSAPAPTQAGDVFVPSHTALLRTALNHTPPVRAEVLAAAVQLASDPSYPSPEIIAHVARLIAHSPDPSEIAD